MNGENGFIEQIWARLAPAPVAHFDETGMRSPVGCGGCTRPRLGSTCFSPCTTSAVSPAVNAAGVLPRFTGIAVHDGRAPCDTYDKATHARCNACVLRELQSVIDHHDQTGGYARQLGLTYRGQLRDMRARNRRGFSGFAVTS